MNQTNISCEIEDFEAAEKVLSPQPQRIFEEASEQLQTLSKLVCSAMMFCLLRTDILQCMVKLRAAVRVIAPLDMLVSSTSCRLPGLIHKGNFQALNKRLLISNDSYMRTTSAIHKETSQRLWKICADQGDIFLGKYEVRIRMRKGQLREDGLIEGQM